MDWDENHLPLHSRILYVHTSDEASLKYIEERVLLKLPRLQLLRSRWLHSLWIQGRSLLVKEPWLLGLWLQRLLSNLVAPPRYCTRRQTPFFPYFTLIKFFDISFLVQPQHFASASTSSRSTRLAHRAYGLANWHCLRSSALISQR